MNAFTSIRPVCDCGLFLNAGLVCEDCGYEPAQTDLDCQQAIEATPGALPFIRSTARRFNRRSDGNVRRKYR